MNKVRKKSRVNYNIYGYLFIFPFIAVFLFFGLYPIINTFGLSFTDSKFMNGLQGTFVGLKNFEDTIKDPVFIKALKNTWYLWILNFIPQLGFALLLAAMFTNQRLKLRGSGVFKAVFYLPNLLVPATVASMFYAFFGMYGPVNKLLGSMHLISTNINWLTSGTVAQNIVIFIQWWMWFGQTTIILCAGMTSIPVTYYEAGMVDGASQGKMFFKITLPLLKPIMVYTLVTSLVGGMQMFDIPFLLTNQRGDPSGSIMTLNVLMNLKRTSAVGDVGSAAAVSICVFIMSAIVAVLLFGLMSDKDDKKEKKRRVR